MCVEVGVEKKKVAVELKRANGRREKKKRKKLECAFQTTLPTLARSRASPRRALRAVAATLSAGEEGGTGPGRSRATIRERKC